MKHIPPSIVNSPQEFAELATDYFDECKENGEGLTMTGLALALGFASRQSIHDYSKREGYEYVTSLARLHVENSYEKMLQNQHIGGPVFALKQMGWSDKQDLALTSPDGSMSPKDQSAAVLEALKRKHESK